MQALRPPLLFLPPRPSVATPFEHDRPKKKEGETQRLHMVRKVAYESEPKIASVVRMCQCGEL